jgi:hypothetical protein
VDHHEGDDQGYEEERKYAQADPDRQLPVLGQQENHHAGVKATQVDQSHVRYSVFVMKK